MTEMEKTWYMEKVAARIYAATREEYGATVCVEKGVIYITERPDTRIYQDVKIVMC